MPLQRRGKLRRGEGVVLGAGDLDGVMGGDGAHLRAAVDGFAVCQPFDQAARECVARAGGQENSGWANWPTLRCESPSHQSSR